MKEKHKLHTDFCAIKPKKSKKKSKKKYDRSSETDSSDDQWVEASSSKNTKHKKKTKKRHKSSTDSKEKKMKKHKKYSSSFSSSESCTSEYLKSELPISNTSKEERDSWMNEESFVPTLSKDEMFSSSRQKRIDSKKQQREEEDKIQRERELNPHLKNEGTGLPVKEIDVESLSLPSTSVGDGGYSWLKKAYYRIQEQAQIEGRSMEEVAVERWGSLRKLISLIEEAEARMKSQPDFKQSKNLDTCNPDRPHSKSHFKKPSMSYEREKSFDSLFQFKKPTRDSKSHKKLNQFKSSKKSSCGSYDDFFEKIEHDLDYSKPLHMPRKESSDTQTLTQSISCSNKESRIPAWKKPKYSEEKIKELETFVCQQSPVSCSIQKATIKNNASDLDNIPVIYSDDDLSKLAAKQIKAEIMGDNILAEKLKKQLEEARSIIKEKGFAKQSTKKVEEVILTKVDSQGQARPIETTQEKIENYKHKKSNKFFGDDSRYSLKQMFEREKLTTADDHMQMFVEASAHSNETAEIDYESGHISKKLAKKLSSTHEEERDIGKAIQQHQKLTSSLERCEYCLDQPRMKKYLIVDIGEQVYLSLPGFQTLIEGHCLIVPKAHVSSFLSLDENEWKEVNDFKNQLRNLFRSKNKSVLFLETSMNFRYFPHAVIECIPVPKEDGDMAPFYFKKAIQESETEWTHNKKLIDLANKGLRHSVPKGLPYFHIEFDPQVHPGYAHVIEEEKYFPRNFGKEVIGGMLDIDYNCLYKNRKEDPLKKSQDVADFEKIWRKFKNVS